MNASLRRISVIVMALIVLLLLNATYTQVFTADGLRADPRNQRVLLDEYSRQRGQLTAGGQLLAYSVAAMKEYGIVDSGDSLHDGIGAMSDERATSFFDKMVRAGVVRPDIDFRKAYTLRFINKGVGLDLRPKK